MTAKGKGDLLNLYSAEAVGLRHVIHKTNLFCGLYLNELLFAFVVFNRQ